MDSSLRTGGAMVQTLVLNLEPVLLEPDIQILILPLYYMK